MNTSKKAQRARLDSIHAGLLEEIAALNAAIKGGAEVRLVSSWEGSNGRRVVRVVMRHDGLWVITGSEPFTQSWCFANDSRWAGLLAQAGVIRDARAA